MSFFKRLRRNREIRRHRPVALEIQSELSSFLGEEILLIPADTKGGYDEIYYAANGRERLAVVRVNSDFKTEKDPIGPLDPGIPLGPKERLDREWNAYGKMWSLGLSPQPLWRNDKAIACSWVDWERAARRLVRDRSSFWTIAELILSAVRRMHEVGVTHLDLNLGNILVDPSATAVLIIDFEFGAVDWVSMPQQRAFDYLRLVDDFTKARRGGEQFLSDVGRMIALLDSVVDQPDRDAELSFVLHKLKRLADRPALVTSLQLIFHNLVPGS